MRKKSDEKTNLDFKGFKTFAEDRKKYDIYKYNCMLGLFKLIC